MSCHGCGSACSVLTNSTGSFSDGSGTSDYANDADCSWIIAPPGANRILLRFPEFSTQQDKDVITVYHCSSIDCTYQKQLTVLSGNNVSSSLIFSLPGFLKVTFGSDSSVTAAGFTAKYTSVSQGSRELHAAFSLTILFRIL